MTPFDPASGAVLVHRPGAVYPPAGPFHPGAAYPEYPFGAEHVGPANDAYALVREALRDLQMDAARFGTPEWNPLGDFLRPGARVVIKPNLVLDRHPAGGDPTCLVTHGAVARAVLDYVSLALGGAGEVVIGDAPLQGTDFGAAARAAGLPAVLDFYRAHAGVTLRLVDFRQVHAVKDAAGNIRAWREVPGDPAGYAVFDLGDESLLRPLVGPGVRFRVAKYRARDTARYHGSHSHRYVIARSLLLADGVINLPKMKTHCKAGVTLALKNFVGAVGRKQCLAHHRQGGPRRGGDEYPENSRLKDASAWLGDRLQGSAPPLRQLLELGWRVSLRLLRARGVPLLGDGSWHGNDTVWRMTLDLNRILRYGAADGTMHETPRRAILSLVDGLVAGEGEGPLEAAPRAAGLVIAGLNPVAVDLAGAAAMGFDYRRIPLLRGALAAMRWPLWAGGAEAVSLCLNRQTLTLDALASAPPAGAFLPAAGWREHLQSHEVL